jgi:hypothetical protein
MVVCAYRRQLIHYVLYCATIDAQLYKTNLDYIDAVALDLLGSDHESIQLVHTIDITCNR